MKKLLMTGATGFVGENVLPLLESYYHVTTCGRSPESGIRADLSKEIPVFSDKYDIVLHAAGKAHTVPKTEEEIKEYYDINYQGTVNLCTSFEKSGVPETIIFVSSAAVYGCDKGENVDETCDLNPKTPYAISKKKAEDYLCNWCLEHQVRLSIIRPSLIAGPNPPGNLGSMINGIATGRYLSIGGGLARKSMLMVEDIARLVPLLEQKGGIYNVCSDDQPSFRDLETVICKQIGRKMPVNMPLLGAKFMAVIGDLMGKEAIFNTKRLTKMTETLTFSNAKAKKELGWEPLSVIENFRIC